MASVSTVVTRGYGTWGSVNLIPTLGYGIGAAVDYPQGGIMRAATIYADALRAGQAYQDGIKQGEIK